MNNVKEVIVAIYAMDKQELNQVIEAIKLQRNYLTRRNTVQIRVGDTVEFDAKTRGVIRGTVNKVNVKTVQVTAAGVKWRVHSDLIKVL